MVALFELSGPVAANVRIGKDDTQRTKRALRRLGVLPAAPGGESAVTDSAMLDGIKRFQKKTMLVAGSEMLDALAAEAIRQVHGVDTPAVLKPAKDPAHGDFQVNGVMYYVDPYGKHLGYEDVFTKIDMCRAHFEKVGLGADYVKKFIR